MWLEAQGYKFHIMILIYPNGRCKLIRGTPKEILGANDTEHCTLNGCEYLGMKLGLYTRDDYHIREEDKIYNKLATKLTTYVRDPIYLQPVPISGKALLYDGEGDLDMEKWSQIFAFIKAKKRRDPPEELRRICEKVYNEHKQRLKEKPGDAWAEIGLIGTDISKFGVEGG